MDGGEGTVMAGVHGLEHVEGFLATHFADDDPVRPHAQAVAHQVALDDFPPPLDIGRAGFQAHDVVLLELQLGGILDGHDALVFRE